MSFFDNARVAHAKKQAKRSWHNSKALEQENARLLTENRRLERAVHHLGGQFDRATGEITDVEAKNVAI